jgi:predicted transcriptional regulator
MPILGNLSEFPLPEVLLLIGSRTGRLRLLDVPEFGIMDVDFTEGEAQAMYLGAKTFTDATQMIDKLSAVVQVQAGMFEFRLQPVIRVERERPLMVNQLVMSLVCHVDEQMARQQQTTSPNLWYTLESPEPEIWIEPELNSFFLAARELLVKGASLDHLAEKMEVDKALLHQNLTNLRLLGLIKLVDGTETVTLAMAEPEEKISRKNVEFLRASRVVTEIKRLTGRLMVKKK